MSLFSTHGGMQGQMNAGSLHEAFQQIAKYASVLEQNMPSNMALQQPANDERRDELISRALMTHEGKLALAQAI